MPNRVTEILIGRDKSCDVVLDAPTVSSRHARLRVDGGSYMLEDMGSTNGTFVNGCRVDRAVVSTKDAVLLGDAALSWPLVLKRLQDRGQGGLLLECLGLEVRCSQGTRRALLQDVTFSATGGQLVALIGPSGAGKSTLLRTFIGQMRPSSGSVLCNGVGLGTSPEIMWNWVGYVPQDDIVHRELSLCDALTFASQLRTPRENDPAETARRVFSAADMCDLTRHLGKRIHTLSGGERKRSSVAMELLTQPPILIFDEPTSGLDPGLERSMMSLFRRLADRGHLVLVTTHATRSLELCDRVLVLADGRVCFFGSYSRMLWFFRVPDPGDLYERLQDPAGAADAFQRSPEFGEFVARPISGAEPTPLPASARPGSALEHLGVLLRRYTAVLRGDPRNVAFLALQAPIIAAVIACVFPADTFTEPSSMHHAAAMLFVMVMAALWFGTSNAAREIVKERSIYQRESILGIDSVAYLFSKAIPLCAIGVCQALLLMIIVGLRTDWYGSASAGANLGLWLVLSLVAGCGCALGLLVSAMASSPDQAMSLTPIVLLPQMVFSGIFAAIEQGGSVLKLLSRLSVSNWGYSAAGSILGVNDLLAGNRLTAGLQSDAFDRPTNACLGVLGCMLALLLAGAWVSLRTRRN